MQIRSFRCIAAGVVAVLGACIAAAASAPAGATGREPAVPEPEAVSVSLDQFIHIVLTNHPTLGAASPTSARNTQTAPSPAAALVVRSSGPAGRAAEAGLREQVNDVLFQAIEAYWGQVRQLGEVEFRKSAVARAEAMAQSLAGGTEPNMADLLRSTAETFLAETRIALHRAQQQAAAGEDRLKLLMNDESLSVESDTRLVLVTEPSEPPAGDDLDLTEGIETAVYNRLDPPPDRRDKVDRRKYETLALEVKSVHRRWGAARTMFLLARDRVVAAQKALDAAADAAAFRGRMTSQLLLTRIRAQEALPDAERQLLAARVDCEIALAAWYRATGQLHEQWNVRAEAGK